MLLLAFPPLVFPSCVDGRSGRGGWASPEGGIGVESCGDRRAYSGPSRPGLACPTPPATWGLSPAASPFTGPPAPARPLRHGVSSPGLLRSLMALRAGVGACG